MAETKKGGISVQTEHIFPIIKKWLYAEKDIFVREIVSNACDAVTKLKRLESLGEAKDLTDTDYKITVTLDKEERTLTVSDNGIGMTEEELQRYLCEMALSGALDFIQKYEGKENEAGAGIIGHFGLGFYSSFMVSDTVDVITKSYTGAPAVKWVCAEAGDYEITAPYEKETRGTDVVMHINEGEDEWLNAGKIRETLDKYCAFMPVEIYFTEIGAEEEKKEETADSGDKKKESEEPKPLNDTHPLWQKNPSDCTEEEYKEFYHKVFHDYRDPLFWIHINADYPLNFRGILYFPKLNHEYENLEGQVKLYYNQVFVADNIKEVIPEYLLMLRGVMDCPELPLNVSRSYLQNSGYVAKISAHIVKKVTDKLNSLFNTDRANYEKLWGDIRLFAEYGCLRDHKFYDKVKDTLLLPVTDGTSVTVGEYLDAAKEAGHENTVYYATDKVTQAQYISLLNDQNVKVAYLDKLLDAQFITMLESDRKIRFSRVDADISGALKGDGEEYKNDALAELFKKVSGNEKLTVRFENLKNEKTPAILNVSEESRRFEDMMKMYAIENGSEPNSFPAESTLVLNAKNNLIRRLGDSSDSADAEAIAKQIYRLALLGQRQLTPEELRDFLTDSYTLLEEKLGG